MTWVGGAGPLEGGEGREVALQDKALAWHHGETGPLQLWLPLGPL